MPKRKVKRSSSKKTTRKKGSTRRKSTTKAPVANKKLQNMVADQFAKQRERDERRDFSGGGGKVRWFKPDDTNRIRLLLDPAGRPVLNVRLHTYRYKRMLQSAMHFDWLFRDDDEAVAEVRDALIETGELKPVDYAAWKDMQDPMQALAVALVRAEQKEVAREKGLWARSRYFWNVLDRKDGRVYVYESGYSPFYTTVSGMLVETEITDDDGEVTDTIPPTVPHLFDPKVGSDLLYKGSGKSIRRKYEAPQPLEPSPVGDIEDEPYDLVSIVTGRVGFGKFLSYSEKVDHTFELYGDLIDEYDLDLDVDDFRAAIERAESNEVSWEELGIDA